MTSDEKRREVAERLRNASARRGDAPWMVEDLMLALGFRCYEDGEDQLFARLADLIDRPMTRNLSEKPKTRKRAIYLVTDFGGDWEDAWERPVIAFTDKARAEECAAKRETRQYDEYGPIWDYEGSEVKEIPLVDFGDRQEEASRYAESACAGL